MELCASREYVLAAMDRKQEIQKLFLINLAAEVFAVLLFVVTGENIVFCLSLIFVLLYGIICTIQKMKEETRKITDLTNSRLSIDGEWLKCVQTAENDTYEECFIHLTEIKKVICAKEDGVCGFYVYLSDEAKKSSLFVNRMQVERKLFFVNGFGYSYEAFVDFYKSFMESLPKDVEIGNEDGYVSWKEKPMKLFYVKIASPFIFVFAIALIRILVLLGRT